MKKRRRKKGKVTQAELRGYYKDVNRAIAKALDFEQRMSLKGGTP